MSGSFLTGPPREAEQGGKRRAGEDLMKSPLYGVSNRYEARKLGCHTALSSQLLMAPHSVHRGSSPIRKQARTVQRYFVRDLSGDSTLCDASFNPSRR